MKTTYNLAIEHSYIEPELPAEPRQTALCEMCGDTNWSDEMVMDFIKENPICNRMKCIKECESIDLEHCSCYDYSEIVNYYEQLKLKV